MIKILILSLFCQLAWGKVSLEFKTTKSSINQGEIVEGSLVLSEGSLPPAGLQGKTLGKAFYVFKLDPFMSQSGSLQANAKIIFSQVPEASSITEVINGEEVNIFWSNLDIQTTEPSQSFLLGDFEVPDRKKILPWILFVLIVLILGLGGWYLIRRNRLRRESKQKKLALRNRMAEANTYEEIVAIWQNKHQTLKEFPNLEPAFKSLETTLFKYQFKPHRTSFEIEQVMEAYRSFKDEMLKGTHGI